MLSELTNWLLEAIKSHGILAVILGVAIETVIVPLPSPLIIMAAGYILIPHGTLVSVILAGLWISSVAAIAQTIGSLLLYLPGYYIGKPFIDKYERFHGVSWKDVILFKKKFGKGKNEELTLFFLRALPIMPLSVVSGLAGVMKTNLKKYLTATVLGTVPRNFLLAMLGFFFGEFYKAIAGKIDNAETIMTAVIIAIILVYLIAHKTGMFEKIRKAILK